MATAAKTRFQLYVPLQKSNLENVTYELNPNGTLDIQGIASTGSKDLQGDVMLPSAIASMKKQILSLGKNLHGDHKPFLFDGLLGAINKVYETDNDKLEIGATILSKYASDVKEMLDIGVNLGFSVGGAMKEYTINKSNGLNISDVYLDEISLTAIPANLDTLGTVTTQKGVVKSNCLNGVCYGIRKNLQKNLNQKIINDEEINMSEEGKQQNQQNNNNDELDSKIKATVDELWNEKQQGLVTAIVNEIKPELKNIVHEEINKKEEPPEGNTGGSTTEGGETPGIEKHFNQEETNKMIKDTITKEMSGFKEQFFKNLNESRNPESNVNLNKQEDILNKNNQQPETNNNSDEEPMVKTYSTTETSKILLKKQRSINPIVSAALNNL